MTVIRGNCQRRPSPPPTPSTTFSQLFTGCFPCFCQSVTPVQEEGRHLHRQHQPGADATRKRRFSQSAKARRPSARKPPKTSGSNALQWARAVCAKSNAGRSSDRPSRSASCPPRRQNRGPGSAGCLSRADKGTVTTDVESRLSNCEGRRGCNSGTTNTNASGVVGGADPSQASCGSSRLDDTSQHLDHAGGRSDLGRGDGAHTSESRDTGERFPLESGPHDGGAFCGSWLSATGVDGEVTEYSTDGDGYSDDSFAPDGDNFGTNGNLEETCNRGSGTTSVGVHRSDFEHPYVDAIPSTLVETGREADD